MDDRTIYTEVSKGLWRAALFYRNRKEPYSGPGKWTNQELALKLARSSAEAAALADSATANETISNRGESK